MSDRRPLPPGDGMPDLADLRARVGDVAGFVGSVARLLRGLATDPRVPRSAKLVAVAGAGYALSPIDVVPDFLPMIGLLDDLWIVTHSLRYLLQKAGHDVVREHWDGTDDGFAALLFITGLSQ